MLIRGLRESDDRFALSAVYEASWRAAYRGIVPQPYLDSLPAGRWADFFDLPGIHTLVAEEDGKAVGTASFCASRFPEYGDMGEVVSLYLLPERVGCGLGRELFGAALVRLAGLGFKSAFLWVLEENRRARAFYELAGFVWSGAALEDEIGGKRLRELQYVGRLSSNG